MKKFFLCLLMLLVPSMVSASTYNVKDMKIDIDDEIWYVFTRDNLENNTELDELGIDKDAFEANMKKEDIYLDAILFTSEEDDDFIEFLVIPKSVGEEYKNLHKYKEKDIKDLGKVIKEENHASNYQIYGDKYKYINMEYKDSSMDVYLFDYYTVINGNMYNIKSQKATQFTDEDKKMITKMVDSIEFKLEDKYEKEPISNMSSTVDYIIICALIGAAVGGIVSFIQNKKRNAKVTEEEQDNKVDAKEKDQNITTKKTNKK